MHAQVCLTSPTFCVVKGVTMVMTPLTKQGNFFHN